ncbi:MAG: tyrosine-type recombinase/integrase [Desulfobacterales bacterium]|nr:tyrosine-type recombinase/integrase [Desulfobacterales bacterium]
MNFSPKSMTKKPKNKLNPEIHGTCEGRTASWSRGISQGFLFSGVLNDPVCKSFFEYSQYQRALSINTLNGYYADLRTYDVYLTEQGVPFREVTTKDLDDFITYLATVLKNSKSTIARKVQTLRAFYKYLYRMDEVNSDVMKKIDAPRIRRGLPKYLTLEQQQKLIDYFDKRPGREIISKWIRARDRAMVIMFLDTGLRVSELVSVKLNDLKFDLRVMKVKGKGEREDEVFLSDRLIETLNDYIENSRPHVLRRGSIVVRITKQDKKRYVVYRAGKCRGVHDSHREAEKDLYKDLGPDEGYLFCRHGNKKMDTRHIYRILWQAGIALGFDIHPHLLRHTFASNLRTKGADLLLIKEALRHADIITTQIYAHISSAQFKRNMGEFLNDEVCSPRAPTHTTQHRTHLKVIK